MKKYKIWAEERKTGGMYDKEGFHGYLEFPVNEEIPLHFTPYEIDLILKELKGWSRNLTNQKPITPEMKGFVIRNIERQLLRLKNE